MSGAKDALALLDDVPSARTLLAEKGYDADWLHLALEDKGITACIPTRRGHKNPVHHDWKLDRQRHRIENILTRPKELRRIATRHDRCGEPTVWSGCWRKFMTGRSF